MNKSGGDGVVVVVEENRTLPWNGTDRKIATGDKWHNVAADNEGECWTTSCEFRRKDCRAKFANMFYGCCCLDNV
jgi:hypothetical protein